MPDKILIILISVTIGLAIFSWYASISENRYHGIYRFFSFESIFIIILLNSHSWFDNPSSILQISSWLILLCSLIFAVYGFLVLKVIGKPKGKFENTTVLIESGLYKYIRHPLYLSLILLGIGSLLKNIETMQIILSAINIIALFLTAKVEEKEMLNRFGEQYSAYIKRTKMFIPYIF